MSTPVKTDLARAWLAQADTDPEHAYTWWDSNLDGFAILPAGRLFDAIEISTATAARVLGAAGTDGPAIRDDTSGRVHVLVPPGTAETWDQELARCLGVLHYLRIPAVTRRTQPGPYWLTPPDGSGHLNDPTALSLALIAAATR
ncbi:hypothetical protein P3T37_001178 [Kitasatospora sp. MAA4]|uniref:hypothetical protein n=1 Tax=Kitasatospora sp. MAA4 TaxID=3035093 RepID=UPI002473AA0C|nr:hypothetical protein [Kitasatospora sp. MAA4]MDH6131804.1 hypothetical protein [Kitasatospora sp. MAA4]